MSDKSIKSRVKPDNTAPELMYAEIHKKRIRLSERVEVTPYRFVESGAIRWEQL